ncbi:hypothetical protein BCR35DRAFT_331434 [Leucosporidium creatinivorum]|uniref:F-box domain-containing protein n=1 Tax=Leucosporidium creatinivorum TaxID=106004 RepID=A0A1Y2FEL8_9BASI|nr:hypothetical protein BCR35DRAFT_331434 [Leucosporidium creatinivorum]
MDDQPAQQPTSTTYARPQQPAEAFASTLPVETLTRIFELALEGFVWPDEDKGQAQRIKYGLVCRSWCSAALPLPHYVVTSSIKAERLAKMLKAARRSNHIVTSIDIAASVDEGAGRGPRIAKLLAQCPKLERLVLQSAVIGGSLLPNSVLAELLGSWPNLTSLRFHDARYGSHGAFEFKNVSAHLTELFVAASDDLDLTRALIEATSNTLKRLFIGEVLPTNGEAVVEAIKLVLPQLTSFTVLDGEQRGSTSHPTPEPTFLETALKQLTSVESLVVGLHGYDSSNLFTLLSNLKSLRHFCLEESDITNSYRTHSFAPETVISFLRSPPPALRSVKLPLLTWWRYGFDLENPLLV